MRKLAALTTRDISLHRPVLYGFAALWIVLFHTGFAMPDSAWFVPLKFMQATGACGVEIFILLTGAGLYRSLNRNPDVKAFWKKRFVRVIVPTLVVSLVYFAVHETSFVKYCAKVLMFPFWLGVPAIWYGPFIFTMYLIYPWLHKMQKKSPRTLYVLFAGTLVLAFLTSMLDNGWADNCNRAVARIPLFILSAILAPVLEQDRKIPLWVMPAVLAAGIAVWVLKDIFGLSGYAVRTVCYTFIAAFAILLITWLCRAACESRFKWGTGIIYRFLAFCGGISLEIYLCYGRMITLMKRMPLYQSGGISQLQLELAGVPMAILLALLLSWFCAALVKRYDSIALPEAAGADKRNG